MFSSHLNPIPHLHNILDEVLVMETARGLMTVDVYPGGTSPRPWFLSIGGCCCSLHDQPLLVNGQKIGMVSLVRQVRQISQGNLSYSYLVEDDTGRIEAIHYIGDDNSSPPPLQ